MITFLECPIGYIGRNCTKKCNYPFYGEDWQSLCDCSKDGCHYSHECFPIVETLPYQHLSMLKRTWTFKTQH